MEWNENTDGNWHDRHVKNTITVTSYWSLCLGLGSNNLIIQFFSLIIWEFFIWDLIVERSKSVRILSIKSVAFSFHWPFGNHRIHQLIWNQKVSYFKFLCFHRYSNCNGCQTMGDDKDTMPDSRFLMYARGLCVGYPQNVLQ